MLLGVLLSIAAALLCLAIWGIEWGAYITGGIGLFFLGLSMLTSGSLVSGDRMRANFTTESMSERHERNVLSVRLFIIGIPNLVLAACILYFL